MNRATIFQAAVVGILVGLFFILSHVAPLWPAPVTVRSPQPATSVDDRQRERERLEEEVDRVWREQQQR